MNGSPDFIVALWLGFLSVALPMCAGAYALASRTAGGSPIIKAVLVAMVYGCLSSFFHLAGKPGPEGLKWFMGAAGFLAVAAYVFLDVKQLIRTLSKT